MPETLSVVCPKCGLVHHYKGQAAPGATLVCTRCQTEILVSAAGDTPTLVRPADEAVTELVALPPALAAMTRPSDHRGS